MTELKMIQKFGQQAVVAMAAVLEVEVVLVDAHLCLIAGTGFYKNKIGKVFEKSCISYQVLITGKTFIVLNAGEHEICRLCSDHSDCPDMAEICLPIVVQNNIIGTFAIIALDNNQKEKLLSHKNKLAEFATKISDLIASAIEARQLTDKLSTLADEFRVVINAVHNGIIVINSLGLITQANSFATGMLKISKKQLIGKRAVEIFKDPVFIEALKTNTIVDNQEIFAELKGKKVYFWGHLTPINKRKGQVLVIRDISEVNKIVGNYFRKERRLTFGDIKGTSTALNEIKEKAKLVAKSNSTILIQGESGTGKELLARAIHVASLRSYMPLVVVNCGAIPESLLESELFGYEEGAFTGAKRGGKPGRFELAHKGTLFLDEIGDMPLHMQAKLLRVLQEKVVDRLGGIRPALFDVRIIAATNKNLELLVQSGEFRQDLYYRLSVIPLSIPPLRERREDILILLDYFRKKFNILLNKTVDAYSTEAEQKLLRYHWPGNIRELENAVEYAINFEQETTIQISSIPKRIFANSTDFNSRSNEEELTSIPEMEKQLIIKALKRFGTSTAGKEKAAAFLSIGIATLYRRIKHYKIL